MKKPIDIEDGMLIRINGGTLFRSHSDDSEVFFPGIRAHAGGLLVAPNGAFQLWGHIFIGRRWHKDGFLLHNFAHEYGHFLQERSMGHIRYFFRVALPSLWSLIRRPLRHGKKSFEREATRLGLEFITNNHISCQKKSHSGTA